MQKMLACGFVAMALTASWVVGRPVENGRLARITLPPAHTEIRQNRFIGGESARLIASGTGTTGLSAYVFDADGNCVAKDDSSDPRCSDDLGVEWRPVEASVYTIELRNCGRHPNSPQVAIR